MSERPALSTLGLTTGKKARLARILFQHGLGNGTALSRTACLVPRS